MEWSLTAVYGTIVITSTLVIYDGSANLRVLGAVAVILGPVVAMVIGHIFAASLAAYAELGRRSTKRELLRIVRPQSRFRLVCVPQIVLLLSLKLAGMSLNGSVRLVIWTSAASLGFGAASRRRAPACAAEGSRSACSRDSRPAVNLRERLAPLAVDSRVLTAGEKSPVTGDCHAGIRGSRGLRCPRRPDNRYGHGWA